jgi:TRAP-type C4-dicarboxylate transport system substrate-binding protein
MSFFRAKRNRVIPWLGGVTFLVAIVLLIGINSKGLFAKSKPKTFIKFATLAPEGSTWMKIMHSFDDELRASTNNRVGFKFYPGGVQGDEMDVLRKIRNGQLHAGGFTGFGLGAIAPGFRALELPFMYRNLEEVDYAREKLEPYFVDLFDKKGFMLLGWADVGFVYLFSNQPITSPEDLQRAKIWTWSGDKLASLFFKAFDVSPIPLALPDVLTSLQMGVVNAVYAPPLACIALQWFTRVKYMTDVPITYGFGAMLISNKMLGKVSPEDTAVLKELATNYSESLIAKTRVQNVEAIDVIREEGVEVLMVDPQVERTFFTVGKSAWKDGVDELYPAELLDRVSSTVNEFRDSEKAASQ